MVVIRNHGNRLQNFESTLSFIISYVQFRQGLELNSVPFLKGFKL